MKTPALLFLFSLCASGTFAHAADGCSDCSNEAWQRTFENARPLDLSSADLKDKKIILMSDIASTSDPSYPYAAVYIDQSHGLPMLNAGRFEQSGHMMWNNTVFPESIPLLAYQDASGDWVTCGKPYSYQDYVLKLTYRRLGELIVFRQEFAYSNGSSGGVFYGAVSLVHDQCDSEHYLCVHKGS